MRGRPCPPDLHGCGGDAPRLPLPGSGPGATGKPAGFSPKAISPESASSHQSTENTVINYDRFDEPDSDGQGDEDRDQLGGLGQD